MFQSKHLGSTLTNTIRCIVRVQRKRIWSGWLVGNYRTRLSLLASACAREVRLRGPARPPSQARFPHGLSAALYRTDRASHDGCGKAHDMTPRTLWRRYRPESSDENCSTSLEEFSVIGETPQRFPATILAPFMIHEALPTHTETAFGSHPCCVVSVTYVWTHCFHGGNTGSNPVGDANNPKDLLETPFFAGDTEGTRNFSTYLRLVLRCPAASPRLSPVPSRFAGVTA
jgi:hypothetical protein